MSSPWRTSDVVGVGCDTGYTRAAKCLGRGLRRFRKGRLCGSQKTAITKTYQSLRGLEASALRAPPAGRIIRLPQLRSPSRFRIVCP